MKVYGIATRETECFGMGDYSEISVIKPTGAYLTGPMPPVFKTQEAAERWLNDSNEIGDFVIVSMNLADY